MASESETYFHQGPDDDNRVSGELVVKLAPETEGAVSASIPSGPLGAVDAGVNRFGVRELDKVLVKLRAASIARVHAPLPETVPDAGFAASTALELGATYRIRFGAKVAVDDAVGQLADVGDVAEVSPNYFRWAQAIPNDPMFGVQWGLTKVGAPAAWDRSVGSPTVVVAVIDTGVDLNHPDLGANIVLGQDLVDLAGVTPPPGTRFEGDFLGRDPLPEDEVGHGTHVAGTIAALTNNGVGVAGVAWLCRIMPVKVLARVVRISDGRVSGSGTAVDIAAGIRWAVDHGARILNLSLGGYSDTFVERDAVSYAVQRGVLVIAAMGNDNTSQQSFPAAYPNVVAVGATDELDRRATFSNVGGHIDVVAPGVGIRSTDWDNVYSNKSGTSMATPHVAGVAALIRSFNPALDAARIAQILRETARPLRDASSDPAPNDRYGHGLVNARAALDRAGPVSACRPCIPPPPCRPRPCIPPPPCLTCRPCIPPPPCLTCRPCIPPPCPPCRPCVPPPPCWTCRPCIPPPPCRPFGPGGFGEAGYRPSGGWGYEEWPWYGGEPNWQDDEGGGPTEPQSPGDAGPASEESGEVTK